MAPPGEQDVCEEKVGYMYVYSAENCSHLAEYMRNGCVSNSNPTGDEGPALEHVTLPVPVSKSHFERFFLLAVDIRVNEDRIELEGDSKSALQDKASRQSAKVSCERLLDAASRAGKRHGVGHVARLGCGRYPVFEVDFSEEEDVFTFLTALQRRSYQDQLEAFLRERVLSEMDALKVEVKLFLAVPIRNNDAELIEVNVVNYHSCLATLHQGAKFDYWSVLSNVEVAIMKEGAVNTWERCVLVLEVCICIRNQGL